MLKILKNETKVVYFTGGHGEGTLRGNEGVGFDVAVQQLENNRYEVKSLNILEEGKIPADANAVIIAGAKI